jgi:hypothetical protein
MRIRRKFSEVDEKGLFTLRLLCVRVISLRALSYGAKFHSALSPTALNFIWRLLRIRLEIQEGAE